MRWRMRVKVELERGVEGGGRLPYVSPLTSARRYLHCAHEERAEGEQPPLGRDTDGDDQIAPDVGEHPGGHTEAFRGLPLLACVQEGPGRDEGEEAPHHVDLLRGWVGVGQRALPILAIPSSQARWQVAARWAGGGREVGWGRPGVACAFQSAQKSMSFG